MVKKCFTLYTATYHRNVRTELLKYKCFFKNDVPTESECFLVFNFFSLVVGGTGL